VLLTSLNQRHKIFWDCPVDLLDMSFANLINAKYNNLFAYLEIFLMILAL
jgi:hypothetical protein